ncbi:hypothetical protein [Streptantibioticus cattleyicolor]|uniref:Transcriptional regulator, TetR family n=1 Tax=Streptantibioticus cattleyicolor (strain ATCC 35852 / DSM 46488 / JCM 4925 / NBRC 14057 / NRRL 8057) TaxID=1003195 RepID=F8JK67_STREN|nr:hypothetical protein [Streptantibioticus cattleyicolor]AEW99790.1 transcriptional regulator, TetR family [Streptantibioticus cattleyicolor NRRL 8057 = DSM 46488]CCB71171.1 protein of unknown function [Streptantibioticus cattleyicolor NRRL 8057 = DSM 46488]
MPPREGLLARAPDPSVTERVEAFAGPLFDEMPAGDEGGSRRSRLIVTITTDPAEELRARTGSAADAIATWPRSRVRCPVSARTNCGSGCGESSP